MATAEELLASAEACDDILTVDLDTRTIIIPKNVTVLGVESDDNVRYLHFRVPRHYCNVDLSKFAIRINYENAKGEGDLYEVKNPVIDDEWISFDWLVGRYACTHKGNVEFNVCMRDLFNTNAEDIVIEWDGDTTGMTLIEAPNDAGIVLCKLSDRIFTDDEIKSGTMTMLTFEHDVSLNISVSAMWDDIVSNESMYSDDYVIVVYEVNVWIFIKKSGISIEGTVFDEPGVYIARRNNEKIISRFETKSSTFDPNETSEVIVKREFNTTTVTLPVLQGLETGEAIIEQNYDILEQWRNDLFGTGDTIEQQIRDVGAEITAGIPASVNQYVADNADALRGESGATFTPSVSTSGDISWTNDKGLANPATVNIKGPKGDTGAGFIVKDYYNSESALKAAITNPSAGDAYGVGTAEPYDIYIYSPTKGWVNNGALQGAKGESGATFTPSVSSAGDLSWTNDKGLTNPSIVNIKGDKGEAGKGFEVVITTGSGDAYAAEVSNIESLTVGASFIMVPHTVSTSLTATLNVNGLGAKVIRRGMSIGTSTTTPGYSASWLAANKPILVTYNGTYWIADLPRPSAVDLLGAVPIANGGTGATDAATALSNLGAASSTDLATVQTELATKVTEEQVNTLIQNAIGDAIGGSY